MLAAKLFGPKDIRIVECDIPEINENELLIKTSAAAICGSDLRMIENGYKNVDEVHPLTLGHEFSGIIVKTGAAVKGYNTGMKVSVAPNIGCGICDHCVNGDTHLCSSYQAFGINMDGGFAEYIKIPKEAILQGNVMVLNGDVSMEAAAVYEPMSCVLNGQTRADVRMNDTVLVIGAGPIGLMHVMLAKALGASKIFLRDLSVKRMMACAEIVPDIIPILEEDVKEAILKQTNGEGVDVCIVACPSPQMQSETVNLMATNGRLLYFGGLPAKSENVPLNTNIIHYKQLKVCGSTRANVKHYREVAKLVASGKVNIEKLISKSFALPFFADAVAYAKSGEGLKTVIVMNKEEKKE